MTASASPEFAAAFAASGADQLAAERQGLRRAHDRLLASLTLLVDGDERRPSKLPDWTIGHVLTHLARNADANVHMAEGVRAGRVPAMYPEGDEGRALDIAAGATRPLDEIVADVRATIAAIDDAWDRLEPRHWAEGRVCLRAMDDVPMSYLPFSRWREVEIHQADLGLASFGWQQWSDEYVRAELPRMLRLLSATDRLSIDGARHLIAVLSGRVDEPVHLPGVF